MNKEDEFWFWTMKAITEPAGSLNLYLYNKDQDLLAGLLKENEQYIPFFRSRRSENNPEVTGQFSELLKQFNAAAAAFIRLPRLTFEEKEIFLKRLLSPIADPAIKELLSDHSNIASEEDRLDFEKRFHEQSKELFFKYDLEKGKFIAGKVKEMYYPLGITSLSKVLW